MRTAQDGLYSIFKLCLQPTKKCVTRMRAEALLTVVRTGDYLGILQGVTDYLTPNKDY